MAAPLMQITQKQFLIQQKKDPTEVEASYRLEEREWKEETTGTAWLQTDSFHQVLQRVIHLGALGASNASDG